MCAFGTQEEVNPETYYDFNKERYFTLILGSYTFIRKPYWLFILNVLTVVCIQLLYVYGVAAGGYTMFVLAEDKSTMVQTFYALGLMMVSFGLHTGRILTSHSLKSVSKLIKSGIYQYNEPFQEDYVEIKKKRTKQLKFLVSFISNGMFFCAFNNTFFVPLLQVTFGMEQADGGSDLNPYLPFQIYVPFDTRNYLGYMLAFSVNAIIIFTMYATFACHEELYMCTSLQLTTEIEVISYSLRNIEKRAIMRMRKRYVEFSSNAPVQKLYNDPDFQKCLYLCLRENILHHQAILRFRDEIRPYVEATTTVVVLFFSFLMAAAIVIMLENTRPQLTLITDIFGFLPMCWVGQLLANESGETKDALFDTPWPDCSEKFKTLLKVVLANTQHPIMIRTKGLSINISLNTFADMVSVGYKIMNVMRTSA